MKAYRICELKDGKLLTLFHGLNGSRVMPLDVWLTAKIGEVTDGSRKTSTPYKSGFHVLFTLPETESFLKSKFRAKRKLVIVECEIGSNYWRKEHSRHEVYLSEKIKLIKIMSEFDIGEKLIPSDHSSNDYNPFNPLVHKVIK
jgi:hypothetical protein